MRNEFSELAVGQSTAKHSLAFANTAHANCETRIYNVRKQSIHNNNEKP